MRNRLLRPFLIVEFLIAIQTIFTFWSQVGGQYHLDLMFWPWKFGLSLAAATLIVAVTANLVKNGGTIPPDIVPHLFDPFRGGQQSARGDGLGLGLYIVAQIVQAHGGQVEVKTGEGGVTAFHVRLPRADFSPRPDR